MKKVIFIGIITIVIILAKIFLLPFKNRSFIPIIQPPNQSMIISSPSFDNNTKIPPKFTCDGGNINPELIIQNVPEGTESLALVVDDPDAVGGKTFTHWLIWNINSQTGNIKQESIPPGSIEGQNDAGKIGYLGPCPPDKKPHRYFFKLFALNAPLELKSGANREALEDEISKDNRIIEKTEFVGIYLRTN